MPQIPSGLKPWLVPIWNGSHQLIRAVRPFVSAVLFGRFERCVVCGRFGPMLYRPEYIPRRLVELWGLSPRLAKVLAQRESCLCAWCGAKLRARRIARVLLETYPVGRPSQRAATVAAWVRDPEIRQLRVAEINEVEGLHTLLGQLPGLSYSEFRDGQEPGAIVEGVRCEDLTRLTYADASIDLLITSETLEHVPNLEAALREIRRVLAPGGRHVFTVPLLPHVPRTFSRASLSPDGAIVPRMPLICHPGGDSGYPVFTEFGTDLPSLLRQSGFETTVALGELTQGDLAQVFICRKTIEGAANSTSRISSPDLRQEREMDPI